MKLLVLVSLCAASALLARADDIPLDPGHEHEHKHEHGHEHDHDHKQEPEHSVLDRCAGLEMDAVAVNEQGVPYFFKADHVFKGFHGQAEMSNQSFPELFDHLDHVDAAFRMHYDNHTTHKHMFLFLDDKVFSYYEGKLEDGYPKNVTEVFPGVPDHVDAAVECPESDCDQDSVLFFKGHDIFHFNLRTNAVDKKEFKSMPNCTSALRFLDHYYCFHGHMFTKFEPKTGEVHGKYPKNTRDYFAICHKFSDDSDHVERERCSRAHLDAVTSDHEGNIYAFRGHYFLQKDNDTLTADTIEHAFQEVHSNVDAVFSYKEHLYMIKGDKLFVYKTAGENHTLVDGFPVSVKEHLGVDGHVDAAFVCQDEHIVHVIKGQNMYDVDMKESPRMESNQRPIRFFNQVDAALCGPDGVKVVVDSHFYSFDSVMLFAGGRMLPEQHRVSQELLGCDH